MSDHLDPPTPEARKRKHVDVCLGGEVTFRTRTNGFESIDLPYRALPESDLAEVDTATTFLGRRMAAPLWIGAMTGGARLSGTINRHLAIAAQRVGVGLMLGSQRIMLDDPSVVPTFDVRRYAPDVPIVGNLGAAQFLRGFGPSHVERAVRDLDLDGLAIHLNPLQEAIQVGGDGDFRGLDAVLTELPSRVDVPLIVKEVGHGLDARTVARLAGAGYVAFDVAGAGGTSWARVEALVRWGSIPSEDLVEWGTPTWTALRAARDVAEGVPLLASGGIRTGLEIAKAIAGGASWCAVALPLLEPATRSADAVEEVLRRLVDELRIAMHVSGASNVHRLASIPWVDAHTR